MRVVGRAWVVLWCCFFIGWVVAGPWDPIPWDSVPMAKPSDKVDFYYVEAPLLSAEIGTTILGYFDLFHGAVAIHNRNSGVNITINYDADDFYHSFYPKLVTNSTGHKALEWINGGAVLIYKGINASYWVEEGLRRPVTTVSGDLFNKYMMWLRTVNDTYLYYNFWDVWSSFPDGTHYLKGWTCFDFVWKSMQVLHDMGAKLDTNKRSKDWANLYSSSAPILLDSNNPAHMQQVLQYWETLLDLRHASWEEVITTLVDILEGKFYIRVDESYYEVKLHFPFLWVSYASQPWTAAAKAMAAFLSKRALAP